MGNEPWVTMRVWFTKTGRAKYISHLDLNRCMTRAVQRAKIPLWYTEGFNPHPFLTFALPLSLGIDGLRESMDIRLLESVDKDRMIGEINKGLPKDIRVFDVTVPKKKPGKIAKASYQITILPEDRTASEAEQTLRALLAQEQIIVQKKSKSGIKDVDIKPDLDVRDLQTEGDAVTCTLYLPAGSVRNINPHLLFDALEQFCIVRFYAKIVRTDLFDSDGQVFA
ncbi:MAG: TIGR03936 family radical SAM-associated protein [Oscillospiraceae bacterium]|nr:TIGR03936 family radical SAM-associated protein [Oscillospiraceae bacterium]